MMTDDLAKRIFLDFQGQTIGNCTVEKLHRRGGTSVILVGKGVDDACVALKIYAEELFDGSHGNHAQAELERIDRQISLGNHMHPNIVRTLGTGKCGKYHFLTMEYIKDPTLEEALNDVPREKIRHVIQQLAKATLFLHESMKTVHRDIKPANVAVRLSDWHVTLLDLGLIRPIEGQTATDQGTWRFVATKRYAAPEFLTGTMTRDPDGWLAVSFYQLGAILHDLIMRQRLFDSYEGEPLKAAVQYVVPQIDATDVPADLIQLASDCLQKRALTRLELVSWQRFFSPADPRNSTRQLDLLREAVGRFVHTPPSTPQFPEGAVEQHARETAVDTLKRAVDYHLRNLFRNNSTLFPLPIIDCANDSDFTFTVRVQISYRNHEGTLNVTLFILCDLLEIPSVACRCETLVCRGHLERPPDVRRFPLYHGSLVPSVLAAAVDSVIPEVVTEFFNSEYHKLNP